MAELTKEEIKEQELKERADKAKPVIAKLLVDFIGRTVKMFGTPPSGDAVHSLLLSYTQNEYNWLPKEYKENLLKEAFID